MEITKPLIILKLNLRGELEINGLSKETLLKNNISGNKYLTQNLVYLKILLNLEFYLKSRL
jgi:hypothetical protein